jgi:hypothetical protein
MIESASIGGGVPRAGEAATVPTAEPILTVATGYMAARHLFAAAELGVFEALADSPRDLDALASAIGVPPRTARITVDALLALGLVLRDEHGRYANGAAAQHYLSGRECADLRPLLTYLGDVSFPAWNGLTPALRAGAGSRLAFTPDETDVILAGVEAITAGAAYALAATPELGDARHLLDVGGGSGSFSIQAVLAHRDLHATLWELPASVASARRRIGQSPAADRVQICAGDALSDPVPGGHDAVLIANLAHLLSPTDNQRLLTRIADASDRDAVLLLVDFWTDPTHTHPGLAAIMAGEFLLVGGDGDVYSVEEARGWLDASGWSMQEHRPLAGPQTLILARRR